MVRHRTNLWMRRGLAASGQAVALAGRVDVGLQIRLVHQRRWTLEGVIVVLVDDQLGTGLREGA